MKIVLDTNVVISGIFFSGPPWQILNSWKDGVITIALLLTIHAEMVDPHGFEVTVCDDPDDDMFIS